MRWQDVIQGLQIRRRRLPKVARWRAVRARHRLLLPTRHGEGLLSKEALGVVGGARDFAARGSTDFQEFEMIGCQCVVLPASLPIESGRVEGK
jgi:hypothetical protein